MQIMNLCVESDEWLISQLCSPATLSTFGEANETQQ